jgi:hypothetical protein
MCDQETLTLETANKAATNSIKAAPTSAVRHRSAAPICRYQLLDVGASDGRQSRTSGFLESGPGLATRHVIVVDLVHQAAGRAPRQSLPVAH